MRGVRKFSTKRQLRKDRNAWIAYALELQEYIKSVEHFHGEERAALIEEKNTAIARAIEAERDFEMMEKRYRG